MFRSHTPDLVHQEHAAWIVATELVRAITRSAAVDRRTVPQGTPHRADRGRPAPVVHHRPPHPDPLLSPTGTATASLPAPVRAAAHRAALAAVAAARVTTDRHRHRPHKIKSRQAFAHASRDITTRTSPASVHVCGTSPAAA